jgi:hypothetical protein
LTRPISGRSEAATSSRTRELVEEAESPTGVECGGDDLADRLRTEREATS